MNPNSFPSNMRRVGQRQSRSSNSGIYTVRPDGSWQSKKNNGMQVPYQQSQSQSQSKSQSQSQSKSQSQSQSQSQHKQLSQPTEWSQSQSLIKNDSLIRVGRQVQHLKEKRSELTTNLSQIVDRETQLERQNLEKAFQQYQQKVKQVLERGDVKEKNQKRNEYAKQLSNIMEKVQVAYDKAVQEIRRRSRDKNEMVSKLKVLDQRVEQALLSDNEREVIKLLKELTNTNNKASVKLVLLK